MKTERNGILETAWRKIISFIDSPYFGLISFLVVLFSFIYHFFASLSTFIDLSEMSFSYLDIDVLSLYLVDPFLCGLYFACSIFCFVYLILSFHALRKSSAEADKTN